MSTGGFEHPLWLYPCSIYTTFKDANGLSDPYVKFFVRGLNKAAHKSKTVYKDLNPVWDERFVIPVEDPFVPIDIKVGIDIYGNRFVTLQIGYMVNDFVQFDYVSN